MTSNGNSGDVYVSYIKINGRPILPPLLDDATRSEMQHYRELAISVGLKIAERRNKQQDAHQQSSSMFSMGNSLDDALEPLEEQNEPLSPTLTASTDLNQFFDSTIEVSPQPADSVRTSGRLIRSASYTLDQPSASLLAAVGNQDLSGISDEPGSALNEEEEREIVCSEENPPNKKSIVIKKRKKVITTKLFKKNTPRVKIKRKNIIKKTNITNDDVHIDLDLHLDLPANLLGPCVSQYDHTIIQQDHLNYVHHLTHEENDMFLRLQQQDISPKLANREQQTDVNLQVEENELKNSEQAQRINNNLSEDISEKLPSPNENERSVLNNSMTDFSRPATTQTDPISLNHSMESLNDTLSPSNRSMSSPIEVNLPEIMTSIQSEYENKLKELLKQQEIEKQRLKDEFLRQQEHLFQRLSISSPVQRLSSPHPTSPPIRNKMEPHTPRRPLSAVMVSKFAKLPALVRGYLTRRLMKTERVQNIKATVRETLSLAVHLHSQPPPLLASDIALHGRLIQQLDQALIEFHDVFFALPITKRMALIAIDRERLQRGASSARSRSSGSGRVSSATQKAQQRRQQQQQELLTPRLNAKGDTPLNSRRQTRLRDKITFQHSVPGSCSPAHTNGDTLTETRARKISERQASLIKNKRPWR